MNTVEKEKVYQKFERSGDIIGSDSAGINEVKGHTLWKPLIKSESSFCSINEKDDNTLENGLKDQGDSSSSSKKKTPMCLVNELARHYKLQPQYRLIEESGPAHQKTFVVCLKLNEEEYVASGQSIKKAQHAAAQQALEKTSFRLPEVKPKAKNASSLQGTKQVTPTVELNALAMKFNLTPVYCNLPPVNPMAPEQHGFGLNGPILPSSNSRQGDFRLNHNVPNGQYLNADFENPNLRQPSLPARSQRTFYSRRFLSAPKIHRVSLSIGEVDFTGEGPSPQAARHDAAHKALNKLNEVLPSKTMAEEVPLVNAIESDSGLKSPVSLAHELALKLNQTVEFTLLSESGPPHLRTFVVQCKLGSLISQGEGNCKKLAKKKAAESILDEWKKAHPQGLSSPCNSVVNLRTKQKPKPSYTKKKPRNLVKETAAACNGNKAHDPISQLVQLQQAKKEKEPVFTLISVKGPGRQPEFVIQVTVGSVTEIGTGIKKKDAKRAAALKALETLGICQESFRQELDRTAELENSNSEAPPNGQVVPGLLVIGSTQEKKAVAPSSITASLVGKGVREQPVAIQHPKTSGGLRPEIRLRYLSQVMEFEVEFSDFPKGKKGEYVTLVTLNTNPPQVSHGLGSTLEEAHDNAAANMLQLIAEGALDSDDVNKESTTNGVRERS